MMYYGKRQKGMTIYLAMLMMSSALATALFVSSVFIGEFRIAREVADSARAVYVADSAMEYGLYHARILKDFNSNIAFSVSGSDYVLPVSLCAATTLSSLANASCDIAANVTVPLGTKAGCPAVPSCVASECTYITTKGAYGATNRALEIVFPNC